MPPVSGDVPTIGGAGTHPALGLVSAVPGVNSMLLEWRAVDLPVDAPSAALFIGTDPDTLLAGSPMTILPTDGEATVTGLAPDTIHFARLAFADDGGGWVPAGPTLRARTASPIYVAAEADLEDADGQTPATAWPTIELGIQAASAAGGGNLWISGSFTTEGLDVPADIDLYGGFGSSMDLATRDVVVNSTLLTGLDTSSVLTLVRADLSVGVVDGFMLDGQGLSDSCLEVDQRACELRSIGAGRAGRGFTLRSDDGNNPLEVSMVRCAASACQAGGTSIDGAFDLFMEDCAMTGNGNEGLSADSLTGNPGEVSRLLARDCLFSRNGSEGLDVDLVVSGAPGNGRWVIRLEDCIFSGNQLAGCLLDCDYEGEEGWFARFEIEGCEARSNGTAGIHLDVDEQATVHIHRTASAGNGADGVLISSETAPGTVILDACALVGNQQHGLRTEMGNVGVLATHCVFAGNRLGGQVMGVAPILSTSTIAYQQPSPWLIPEGEHVSVVSSATMPTPFRNAPSAWYSIAEFAPGVITLSEQPEFGVGALLELGDDGVSRSALSVTGVTVGLAEDPAPQDVPLVLGWFESSSVIEDWAPSASSPAIGSGLGLPGGAPRDAGPFGSPNGGTPGSLDLVPETTFWFAETIPTWSQPISASESLVLRFEGGDLDSATATAGIDAVDASGAPVATSVFTSGNVVVVSPQSVWTSGDRLQVHDSLRSADGRSLSASIAIPITVTSP